jgi:hypothetical protein
MVTVARDFTNHHSKRFNHEVSSMIPYIHALAEQVCIETDPEKLTTLLDELCREIDNEDATMNQGKIDRAQDFIEHLC